MCRRNPAHEGDERLKQRDRFILCPGKRTPKDREVDWPKVREIARRCKLGAVCRSVIRTRADFAFEVFSGVKRTEDRELVIAGRTFTAARAESWLRFSWHRRGRLAST